MTLRTDLNGKVLPPKRKKKRPANKIQEDIFNTPVQNKYPGPKNVPATSISAYNETTTQAKLKGGNLKALDLVKKFPARTAYELLEGSVDFQTIYDLRRCLSSLKKDGHVFNPSERMCNIQGRSMFTWRLI